MKVIPAPYSNRLYPRGDLPGTEEAEGDERRRATKDE